MSRTNRRPRRPKLALPSTPLLAILCHATALTSALACGSTEQPPAGVIAGAAGQGGSSGAASGGSAGNAGVAGAGGTGSWSSSGGTGLFPIGEPDPDAGAPSCAASEQQAVLVPANLLFLIDRSGSMNCNPPEGNTELNELCKTDPIKQDPDAPSKWDVTRDALLGALDSLAGKPHVSVGISVFPKPDDVQTCLVAETPDVAIQPLDATHRQAIDTLLESVVPRGDTPIAGTTVLGYRYLSERIRAGTLTGNTFVVLFTDGAETCDEGYLSQLVERDVPLATRFNIKTFVIGAPGSEDGRALLSQVAYNGLTPRSSSCDHSGSSASTGDCHFDMTAATDFAAELDAALQAITGDASLACQLDIPTNPSGGGVDLDKVNVTFTAGDGDEIEVLRDDAPCEGEADGWQYSADGTKIVLCGASCDRARNDPSGRIQIELGCPTRRAPLR